MNRGSYRAVLRNPAFLFLWGSQVLSQVADKVFFVLLLALITAHSSSHTMVSLGMIALGLPSALFGVPAGVLVDRMDKRLVMAATNGLRALLTALTPLLMHQGLELIGLAFLISTCSQPFAPAEAATIPMVVPKPHLLVANSLFSTTLVGSIIVGFTLAEPLLGRIGPSATSLAIAGMYLTAALADFGVHYPLEIRPKGRTVRDLLDELSEGWQYIRRERSIRTAILRLVALFAAFAGMSVLAILFAKQQLRVPFSWFLATAGAGMALGSALLGRFAERLGRKAAVHGGFLAIGLALGALAWADNRTAVMAFGLSAIIGVASSAVALPLQTELQEKVPESLRGKVFGAQNMATNLATAVPIAGAGVLSDWIGVRAVFVLMGALMLMAAGVGLRSERGGR